MKYIHVKSLDEHQVMNHGKPTLYYIRVYVSLIDNTSYKACRLSDIEKYRYIGLMAMETKTGKPIPYDEPYLQKNISDYEETWHETINKLLEADVIELVTERGSGVHRKTAEETEDSGRFKKPTEKEVAEHCKARKNGIDAGAFVAHYESKGWLIGKTPMKSWKAAIVTWEKRDKKDNGSVTDDYRDFLDKGNK